MRRVPFALSLIALFVALFALLSPRDVPDTSKAPEPPRPEHHEEVEVAVHMGRIQRYHQKWWAAAKAGNADLAAFYLHEMEEAMELIAQARLMEDGVDLSSLMNTYGLKTVESLEKTLKNKGVAAMLAEGNELVQSCNSCHTASGHAFIRIQEPTMVGIPDQDFTPIGK